MSTTTAGGIRRTTPRIAAACVLLAGFCLAFAAGMPGRAWAGSIAVEGCQTAGGQPAPSEGWHSGWTNAPLTDAGSSNTCTTPGGTLTSYVGAAVSQPGSDGPYWEYSPPSGYSITGGQITAYFSIPGSNVSPYSAATGMLGPSFLFEPATIIGGLPSGEWGSTEGTWSLTGHTGGRVWLYALCEPPNSTCPAGGSKAWYWSMFSMKQSIIVLSNSTQPTASGFSGALATNTPLTGIQSLLFQAADAASGVYEVKAQVSGQTVYDGVPNDNAGECVPVGSYGGALEFTSAMPCLKTESVTIPVNTALVGDGSHELTVTVTDAAGNETIVYSHTIETRNAPSVTEPPSITGATQVPATLTATNGVFTAPPGAGALSGISGKWMRCSDAEAKHCSAIPAANNSSYQLQTEDAGYYIVYANTVSDRDGTTISSSQPTTAVSIPSAGCTVGECQHNSGGGGGGGPVSVTINQPGTGAGILGSDTPWALAMHASQMLVHKGTLLKLSGAVTTSPRPGAGNQLYLQARTVKILLRGHGRARHRVSVYGSWITFLHLRSENNGAWRASYKFRVGGRHLYQLQAIAPKEGGYANPEGQSNILTITET